MTCCIEMFSALALKRDRNGHETEMKTEVQYICVMIRCDSITVFTVLDCLLVIIVIIDADCASA